MIEMNEVLVKSIPNAGSNNQRFKTSAVHSEVYFRAWAQPIKIKDYIHMLELCGIPGISTWRRIESAIAHGPGEQERFKFSQSKVRAQSNEAELAKLSAIEDELITKKISGSLCILDEIKLDSIQEQIDELIGVQSPTEAEQEFLNKFDQLLDQSRELLGKLDKLMPEPEETQ